MPLVGRSRPPGGSVSWCASWQGGVRNLLAGDHYLIYLSLYYRLCPHSLPLIYTLRAPEIYALPTRVLLGRCVIHAHCCVHDSRGSRHPPPPPCFLTHLPCWQQWCCRRRSRARVTANAELSFSRADNVISSGIKWLCCDLWHNIHDGALILGLGERPRSPSRSSTSNYPAAITETGKRETWWRENCTHESGVSRRVGRAVDRVM